MADAGPWGAAPVVRTRFAPAPTGDLHVGNVRTALYAWAHARHTGGQFVFRVEDTDRGRVTDAAIGSAAESLRWLGLDWDEGVEAGGSYGPYLQSERLELYRGWVDEFLAQGSAYHCYCTPAELEAERDRQREHGTATGYGGHCRELTREQRARFEAEGRSPVVRFRLSPGTTVVQDLTRGEVVFDHANIPDFVLMRATGFPLYNLAVAVDDALMQITHVIRGDDLLSSTPRQIALQRAMGVPEAQLPVFAHLPYVLGPDGKPLSKRYGAASISWYRDRGYLPEAVVNYLALLGWSPGDDQEEFTLAELAQLFVLDRVNATTSQLDEKKLEYLNGTKIRALKLDDFVARIRPFVSREGLVSDPPSDEQQLLLEAAAPLVQTRLVRLDQAADALGFLFVDGDAFTVDPESAARVLIEDSRPVLEASAQALRTLDIWTHARIETVLRHALVDGLGLKPKHAFGPVRVATAGHRVSPPLFESLELLGRRRTLDRITGALSEHVG